MRGFIVMAMFAASFADAAWNDYTTVQELELDADGIENLHIDAGAGVLDVTGVSGLDRIEVTAVVIIPEADDDAAERLIDKKMRLSLDSNGDSAKLEAYFEGVLFDMGPGGRIDLDIRVPVGTALVIDDGSGSIDLADVAMRCRSRPESRCWNNSLKSSNGWTPATQCRS